MNNLCLFKLLLLLIVSVLCVQYAYAQEENIYLIKMFACKHKPEQRSQTGFRVRGIKGIVTALHGVADCQRITATNKRGLLLNQPLVIKKIDIDHDAALLSSEQVDSSVDGGLNVANRVSWEKLGTVKVVGHPYGISSLETTLTLRDPPLKPLKELVPATALTILKERRSPNHLINVVNLQGNLLPGHSGAPIIDSTGQVVALANGGLKEGVAGISWAIPFSEVEWDSAGSKLTALVELNPHILFTFDALSSEQGDEELNDETCQQLSRLLAEAKTGFISIVGEPLGTSSFYSKILLPGVGYGYVYPKNYVGFQLFSSDSVQKVASQYYQWISKISPCFPDFERKERDTGMSPKHLRSLFSEKGDGPAIEIGYNLVLDRGTNHNTYALYLHVQTTSFGW